MRGVGILQSRERIFHSYIFLSFSIFSLLVFLWIYPGIPVSFSLVWFCWFILQVDFIFIQFCTGQHVLSAWWSSLYTTHIFIYLFFFYLTRKKISLCCYVLFSLLRIFSIFAIKETDLKNDNFLDFFSSKLFWFVSCLCTFRSFLPNPCRKFCMNFFFTILKRFVMK